MTGGAKIFWPTAHNFAEAVQCPAVCFNDPSLRSLLPAVDRLGMPLVTSGQFAYVFKFNAQGAGGESLALRCFRGFLGDREERYRAIDAHLAAHRIAALPRFKYLSKGVLVAGTRFPVLVMEWVEGPTLDVYLAEAVRKPDVLRHLANEWVRLIAGLRAAGIAHGDLQHGNVIVERGRLRLVDLDGMFVPALAGKRSSEVGHQHYQHPRRRAELFSADMDNFSALVIYTSLVALAERPSLWDEYHDENLLFTRADFERPAESMLFSKLKETSAELAGLAGILERAAISEDPTGAPPLDEIVTLKSSLPAWMTAPPDVEIVGRTREVRRAVALAPEVVAPRVVSNHLPSTPASGSVQTIFSAAQPPKVSAAAPPNPADVRANTIWYVKRALGGTFSWLWWIPLHNVVLTHAWATFGVTGVFSMFATMLLVAAAFFFYGFFRAVYLAETAVQQTPGAAQVSAAAYTSLAARFPATLQKGGAGAQAQTTGAALVMPVIGNRSLKIFHLPGCAWADKIPMQRREDFTSPNEARDAGFRPCRVCSP